jgi:hypothetical protein
VPSWWTCKTAAVPWAHSRRAPRHLSAVPPAPCSPESLSNTRQARCAPCTGGATAVASVLTRAWTARLAVVGGSLSVALGVAITIVGIRSESALPLFLGSGVAGLGFGTALAGSFRRLTPLAQPNERASLLAAVYLVSYTAFSVPAVIAGLAVTHYGLRDTATVYAAVIVVLALIAALATELALAAFRRGTPPLARPEAPVSPSTHLKKHTNSADSEYVAD